MENIGGGLGFAATLDIDDFNVSAEAMDRHLRQVSTNIQMEAEDMEQSLLDFAQKGDMYIQAYLTASYRYVVSSSSWRLPLLPCLAVSKRPVSL